jgi:hypothetical protein
MTLTDIQTLDITLSLPRTIAYKPLKPKATEKAEQSKWTLKKELVTEQSDVWYRQRRSVIGISVVTSAAIMLGVSMGFDFPLTFLPVVWIVPVVSNYTLPRMSIRRVSQVMLGYLVRSPNDQYGAHVLRIDVYGTRRRGSYSCHDPL